MKRFLHCAALALLCSTGLMASPARQDASRQQTLEQVRQRLEQIKDRLGLTPEQVEQVRLVLIDELQQIREMQKDYRPLSEGRMSEIRRARELQKIERATDKKLEKILSQKQMDELKKVREELRQEPRPRF